MVETSVAELKEGQEATRVVVSSLVDRLVAITVQLKDMREQSDKNWDGVTAQLAAMKSATRGRNDNDHKQEQSQQRTRNSHFRMIMELKPSGVDRGNPFPKLKFPDFDGTNVEDWIYKSERYFDLEQTVEVKKVRVAAIHLYGKALRWHYTYIRNRGRADMPVWAEYIEALTRQFEDKNETVDHLGVGDKRLVAAGDYIASDVACVCEGTDAEDVERTEEAKVTEDTSLAENELERIKQRERNVILDRMGWMSSKGGRISIRKKYEEGVCSICCDGGELVLCDHRGCPKVYYLPLRYEGDEKVHLGFHKNYTHGIRVKGWCKKRIVIVRDSDDYGQIASVQESDPPPQIDGAPNYRQVDSLHVHGIAIPTIDGIRNVLKYIGTQKDGLEVQVLWISFPEEPIIYINGRPLVLRDVEQPFSNLELQTEGYLVDYEWVPTFINCRLQEHQREGVKFLYGLYTKNNGGVLGDDMGLGKTIQTIAFFAAICGKDGELDGSKGLKDHQLQRSGPVLIICPTFVILNWESEFSKWSSFTVCIYHGANWELIREKLDARGVEVLITSFDTYKIHGRVLSDVKWEIAVVDEAHRLQNEKSKLYASCLEIKTPRRIRLTGTVIPNKIMKLFNLFDGVAPGCWGTREHFKEYYNEPFKRGQRSIAPERFIHIADERKHHLAGILRKYMLRRTREETIDHFMLGKEDNVVFCAMSALQKRVYKRMLQLPDIQCLITKDLPCGCDSPFIQVQCCKRTVLDGIIWPYLHRDNLEGCDSYLFCIVLPCLINLQQISNHLELIKPNLRDEPDKQRKDAEIVAAIFVDDIDMVGRSTQNEGFMGPSDVINWGKMRALEKLIHSWTFGGYKILLFGYYVRMMDILKKFLIRKGYEANEILLNSLTDTYINCGRLGQARMTRKRIVQRNVVSWGNMNSGLTRTGEPDEALEMLGRRIWEQQDLSKVSEHSRKLDWKENRKFVAILHRKMIKRGRRAATKFLIGTILVRKEQYGRERLYDLLQEFRNRTLEDKCYLERGNLMHGNVRGYDAGGNAGVGQSWNKHVRWAGR